MATTKSGIPAPKGIFFDIDIADPKERVEAYLSAYHEAAEEGKVDSFDAALMRNIKVISATATPTAKVVFEFEVKPEFCSRSRNMHGGAVALLADMTTTMTTAPISRADFWHFGGVSRNLNVTYLRPIPIGITLTIKCKIVQIGKSQSSARMKVYEKGKGEEKLLCVADHSKVYVDILARM